MATTLTVLGKRKASTTRSGEVRVILSSTDPSCSEQSDTDRQAPETSAKARPKPILINGTLSISTGKPYQCTHTGCSKAYAKPSRLIEHERVHTGARPFVCETCKKAYFREAHLHAHSRSHLPEEARPIACDIKDCGKRFWTSQHLKVHQDWHNGAKPFSCSQDGCPEAFPKHHQLRSHIARVHAPPGTKPFICNHEGCPKSFNTNQHLRTHKKTHDTNRYTCVHPTCLAKAQETPNFFPTWSALQHHLRTDHLPTCNHPDCDGRTFASQKGLKAHLKLHEERDFESELNTHVESDADDEAPAVKKPRRGGELGRDWKCEFEGCTKDFKSKKAMMTHKNVTHLGKRDFVCQNCNKSFGYKHLLQRHTTKVHSRDSPTDEDETETETSAHDEEAHTQIDLLTGKAYATRAQNSVARGRALHCPFPNLGDLWQQPPSTSSTRSCSYVFSRVYDLRRHLDSTHGIETDKEELQLWAMKNRLSMI